MSDDIVHYTVPWAPFLKGRELDSELLGWIWRIVEIVGLARAPGGISERQIARVLQLRDFPGEPLEEIQATVNMVMLLIRELGLAYQVDVN